MKEYNFKKGLKYLVKYRYVTLLIFLFVSPFYVTAMKSEGTNYNTNIVIDSGGATTNSSNFKTITAISQDAVGDSSSANYNAYFGFFQSALATPFTETYLMDVNLTSPFNNWYVNETILFECSLDSSSYLQNITVYHNYTGIWQANYTNTTTSVTSYSVVVQNGTFESERYFIWNCYGCNVQGSCFFAGDNNSVTVDLTEPKIDFVSPTPSNGTINSSPNNFTYINVTTTDSSNNFSTFLDWNYSLVGWWRFENNYKDSSSYGNDGTANGNPRLTTGYRGKAYEFDGVDDNIIISNGPDLDEKSEITISLWVKVLGGDNDYLIELPETSAGTNGCGIHYDNNGNKINYHVVTDSDNSLTDVSTSISLDTWYHIALTYNGSTLIGYNNGGSVGSEEVTLGIGLKHGSQETNIGRFGNWGGYFNGTMDEVMIWKRALSPQEINASYQAGIWRLEANFTNLGGNYTYQAYTVDQAGNINTTGPRVFKANRLPSKVHLSSLVGNSTTTNRTPKFNWTRIYDEDGDNLTYQILITRTYCQTLGYCQTNKINVTNIASTFYIPTSELDIDSVYNWSVRAEDPQGYGPWSDVWNLSVDSLNSISLPTSNVDFGSKVIRQKDNTSDNTPPPLTVQNDGNIKVNLTIYSNVSLWWSSLAPLNTSYFMYKAANSTEVPSFNWTDSMINWTNVTSYAYKLLKHLNYNDSNDLAEIELFIEVPDDEPAGSRLTYLVVQSEKS